MNPVNKIECTFGKKCYRLNPTHFLYNTHAHLEGLISNIDTINEENIIIPENFDSPLSRSVIRDQIKVIMSLKKKAKAKPATNNRPSTDHNDSPVTKRARFGEGSSAQESSSRQGARPQVSQHKDGAMAGRWEAAAPFHFFLTRIEDSRATHGEALSITFPDLYDKSLGDLAESLQINFMIDINFVMPHLIATGNQRKPLLMLYETSNMDQESLPSNIKAVRVKTKSAFGHHHTKMSLMFYKDKSLRVVVSTANLIPDDWQNYTQGVWVSPACPEISEPGVSGESPTGFKSSLRSYLAAYQLPELRDWMERVKQADFSDVKVCLVASVPSSGPGGDLSKWGLGRLRSLLRQHLPSGTTSADWPAVVQCSSIGSLGPTPAEWLEGQMKAAMLGSSSPAATKTPFYLVYPSVSDVLGSHDGKQGGGCLPYARMTHSKQLWLQEFLHRWRAERRHRSRATPHIKSYCRVSPDTRQLAWFLLSSANLSKAAWGRSTHQGQGQNIMSYEAGVLFMPKLLIGKNTFEVGYSGRQEGEKFPVPFDLPLTQYGATDKPWLSDYMLSS